MQGDAASLHRLAVILLDNAIKYAGTGGTVTLRLAAAGSQAVLTVHNTGTPIPHRQRNRAGAGDCTKHLPGTPRRYPGGIRAGWHDIPGKNQERVR